ncbi:hypothetical protein PUN28_006075 [Cardiocondyla obscurior]|uniref:Uncharacterized protein n=1 Tax=Cardiocondyla obscurior TaxID=286306 RepID=A0AAW2G9W3_9HYME
MTLITNRTLVKKYSIIINMPIFWRWFKIIYNSINFILGAVMNISLQTYLQIHFHLAYVYLLKIIFIFSYNNFRIPYIIIIKLNIQIITYLEAFCFGETPHLFIIGNFLVNALCSIASSYSYIISYLRIKFVRIFYSYKIEKLCHTLTITFFPLSSLVSISFSTRK